MHIRIATELTLQLFFFEKILRYNFGLKLTTYNQSLDFDHDFFYED